MFGRGLTRFILLAALLVAFTYTLITYTNAVPREWTGQAASFVPLDFSEKASSSDNEPVIPNPTAASAQTANTEQQTEDAAVEAPVVQTEKKFEFIPDHYIYNDVANIHREIFSVSTVDKKYFWIDFSGTKAYNPNIIPHRTLNDTWWIVSQRQDNSVEKGIWFAQSVCPAAFVNGRLECIGTLSILPIAATFGDNCDGNLAFAGFNVGPHDARLFYGPTKPYVLYGSNSEFTCFGQWMQDFRMLVDWGFAWNYPREYRAGTEIQRPDGYGKVEKNWFIFWDREGQMYVHHDIFPKRVFAQLAGDGSVGPNLGVAANDDKCMAAYMPAVAKTLESIHQATNSLSITLCNRADPTCIPSGENTFIFTVFHHKSYYEFHSNYEPYVMLFQQSAPFSVHAIAQKPFWIHGRAMPGEGERPVWITDPEKWHQTEMFYITSMSWRERGQNYHGYLDDVLFLAFGVEDKRTAGIDVLAGELFKDLGLCSAA